MKIPSRLFVLFDSEGLRCGEYATAQEAYADAAGPRFRGAYRVVEYTRGRTVMRRELARMQQ